jgi:NADPH2:quinone reductase
MRGVLVEEFTAFENLTLKDCPEPELGPKQVRIRTQATGISFALSLMVSGRYQRKPPLPFVPAAEVAGIVTDVAEGCERIKVGDRVCAVLDWGGLAEVAVANEVNTFRIPDSLTFDRAISFTNSYATSAAALTWPHLLRLAAGETLLVHGAAGGVGLAAIEIGKIIGATVIATAGSAAKLEAAKAHGADHVINYRDGGFKDIVNELTAGRGVNAVYDPVGGDVFMESLRCIAPEGRIMPVGFASGTIPQIPANILLVKNITVTGLNMGYYIGWSPDDVRYEMAPRIHPLMQQMFDWFEAGQINPQIWETYKLEDFQDAMAAVLGRDAIGRVAVVMDEEAKRLGR